MDSWEPWQSYIGNPVIFWRRPIYGRVCKKAIDFETNNKNGTKYANFDFGLEDYREMFHIIEKENNEK